MKIIVYGTWLLVVCAVLSSACFTSSSQVQPVTTIQTTQATTPTITTTMQEPVVTPTVTLTPQNTQQPPYEKVSGITEYTGVQPTEACGSGHPIKLSPNPNAKNPTWAQMRRFILDEKAGYVLYQPGVFVCCDFSSEIYNDAQRANIRAVFVVVHFSDGSADHALNAFQTTDQGLAYIDVTGDSISSWALHDSDNPNAPIYYGSIYRDSDKIAYISVGDQLGFISLETSDYGPSYNDYKRYLSDVDNFYSDLADHNA